MLGSFARQEFSGERYYEQRAKELQQLLWALLRKHGPLTVDDITMAMAGSPDCRITVEPDHYNRQTKYTATFEGEQP